MLGDADRQQSSRLWLRLRPPEARSISSWDVGEGQLAKPPRGTTHVVLDTPAGLYGKVMQETLRIADKVVVPLSPSIFDIYATRAFLDELAQHRKAGQMQVGIVGTRVDSRTIAAEKLQEFVEGLGLPVLGFLRPTQNYVHLAARGLTLSDVSAGKVERDLEQWQGIWRWLDA
jgi:chromosome partitioning protein